MCSLGLSSQGTLDCFLSVASCTVRWRHVDFGCCSVGGVVRKASERKRVMKLYKMFQIPVPHPLHPPAPPLLSPSLLPPRPPLSKLTMLSGPCITRLETGPCRCAAGQFDAPTADNLLTTHASSAGTYILVSHEGGAEWVSNLLRVPSANPMGR